MKHHEAELLVIITQDCMQKNFKRHRWDLNSGQNATTVHRHRLDHRMKDIANVLYSCLVNQQPCPDDAM